MAVFGPGFEEGDGDGGVFGEAGGEDATGCAAADDEVVGGLGGGSGVNLGGGHGRAPGRA